MTEEDVKRIIWETLSPNNGIRMARMPDGRIEIMTAPGGHVKQEKGESTGRGPRRKVK